MRVYYTDATGCPAGQFVIIAENDQERAILSAFLNFPYYAKDKWRFWKHGSVYIGGKISSFNFGYIKIKEKEDNYEKNRV